MPKKPLTKKEKQMRTGALARQNMFLGGITQSQIGDMVKQYQANQPSATPATPPVAQVEPSPPNLYANKPATPPTPGTVESNL